MTSSTADLETAGRAVEPAPSRGRGKVVVGVDGSGPSLEALRWGAGRAASTGAMLQVVRAWQPAEPDRLPGIPNRDDGSLEARSEIGRLVTEVLGDRIEIDVEADAIRGPAVPVLLEAADNAWLLVLGDRGRGGFAGLPLGSVSLHCAMHAGCSVVVVKEVRERR